MQNVNPLAPSPPASFKDGNMNDDEIRARAYRRWEREMVSAMEAINGIGTRLKTRTGETKFLGLFEPWDIDALLDLKMKGLQRRPIAALAARHGVLVQTWPRPSKLRKPELTTRSSAR